jgi:uncharacterized protein with NAD-binding domain and iron-sulfur cluster
VAVLGAGPAGLAAAFALSRTATLRERFQVTVYQLGWRAGGKSATGRAMNRCWRIEQNGSHYLFGCYLNSFALLAEAYQVLAEHGETRFGTYREQFVPRTVVVAKEERTDAGQRWLDWPTFLPETPAAPECGGKYPPPSHYFFVFIQLALCALLGFLVDTEAHPGRAARWLTELFPLSPFHRGRWPRLVGGAARALSWVIDVPLVALGRLLGKLFGLLAIPLRAPGRAWLRGRAVGALEALARAGRWAARALDRMPGSGFRRQSLHRSCLAAELLATALIGIIADELWKPGRLEQIDDRDFRTWLRGHALPPPAGRPPLEECPLIKIWYDAVVAYQDGDPDRPRISAGVTLHALFRAVVTYKGAFAYQMTHEIGDAFIAPLVRALELRGVELRFFHRVRALEEDGSAIQRIGIELQIPEEQRARHRCFATLPGPGSQQRQVWPNRPLFDDDAAVPNLESLARTLEAADAPDSGPRLWLERGQHFDEVVFTLPPGIARELPVLARQPAWQKMWTEVKSVATQSLRLWFRPDLAELGWVDSNPILSGFAYPYSTWEDNAQNLGAESFGSVEPPGSIATVFGALADGIPEQQRQRARGEARAFFRDQAQGLWPRLPDSLQERYALLTAPPGTVGEARFEWQYQRANVGPLETYVLALPGTLVHRLRPDESGFSNMYLAGEWTRNGFEVGCVEGAVLSGLLAARSITADAAKIVGEDDLAFGLLRPGPLPASID